MPIYDYLCSACDHRADILHGINDLGPLFCPSCGAEGSMRKQFSAPTIHYKGSGWAKKDRGAASRTKATAKSAGESGKDAKQDGSGNSDPSSSSASSSDGSPSSSDGSSGSASDGSSSSGSSSESPKPSTTD